MVWQLVGYWRKITEKGRRMAQMHQEKNDIAKDKGERAGRPVAITAAMDSQWSPVEHVVPGVHLYY
jgi:hypothetical protein